MKAQNLFQLLAQIHRLDDEGWERHANPLSGASRMLILPALSLVIYARHLLGWWTLVLVAALIVWAVVNPRAFPRPRHTTHWMSRAVMGERVLLNAREIPIPEHHGRMAERLGVFAALGLAPLVWGLMVLDPFATLLGVAVILIGKLWFLDRMVWLYEDMARRTPEYRAWQRP